jgi:hypothetical protein
MHNYVVLRLASFLVKHRENVRDGLVPEDYVRHLEYKGQEVALQSESKGYRFKLAARASDRPSRRRPWQRESHQERGAAERGPVGAGSRPVRSNLARGKVRLAEIPPPRLGVIV